MGQILVKVQNLSTSEGLEGIERVKPGQPQKAMMR